MRVSGPRRSIVAAIGLSLGLAAGCAATDPEEAADRRPAGLRVADVLGGDPAGFAVADGSADLVFPRDHGPHPDFRSEWWYLTGNLTGGGRDFGYQLTIFRSAVRAQAPEADSAWATRQVYMGHLAIGDLGRERFRAWDRFARGAVGLAGAETAPLRVWIEDWKLATVGGVTGTPEQGLAGLLPLRVRAAQDGWGIDLELTFDRPLVLQGDRGLSRKGARPENASYYYSVTRLRTRGSVEVDGESVEAEGLSWLDREWSTSALEPGQAGWDWFALQLSDGSDLMIYVMRRDDGSPDPRSKGMLVTADGEHRALDAADFVLERLATWRSPTTGVRYPSRWRVRVPREGLTLEVEPRMAAQELDLAFRYWEGAVAVSGTRGGESLDGRGFVELTGYVP